MFFPSRCNWYGVTVAIALVNLLQLFESVGSVHLLFVIMHLGAFCIENAPTLVATGLTLVAICPRQIATRSCNWPIFSCNGVRFVVIIFVELQLL
jgi:hypothetical protein